MADKKQTAVKENDFEKSVGLESVLRHEFGVETSIKHRGENFVVISRHA